MTWAEFLAMLGAGRLAWVSAETLTAAGVTFLELPLFRPERGPKSGLMDVSAARALGAGLTLTPPAETAREVAAWLPSAPQPRALSPAREAALIDRSRRA
jgi:2'-hydroxyisoflavone reductase